MIKAKKRFGQHFLTDNYIIENIIKLFNPQNGQNVVEIGPGRMALTKYLIEYLDNLTVIELDKDLIIDLKKNNKLNVIESDVLTVNFYNFCNKKENIKKNKIRLIGNLPYNISTPILFHVLNYADIIEEQYFMLQKEVVDRIIAKENTKDYGRLSVILQWRYKMENILNVPPESFKPIPKVKSSVIRMIPKNKFPNLNIKKFEDLLRIAFSQKRKLLKHSLEPYLLKQSFSNYFNFQRRASEVSVKEYINLAINLNYLDN